MDKLLVDLGQSGSAAKLCGWFRSATVVLSATLLLTACGGGGGRADPKSTSSVAVSQTSAENVSSAYASSAQSITDSSSSFSVASSSSSSKSSVRTSTSSMSATTSQSACATGCVGSSAPSSVSSSSKSSTSISSSSSSSSSAVAAIASVEIAPNAVALTVGSKQQLVAVGKHADGALVNLFNQVTWRVASGNTVVSVDANGLVTRLTEGTAEIEARAQGKTTLLKISSDAQNLSLAFDNTSKKWAKVYIYLWTGEGSSKVEPVGGWPGKLLTLADTNLWPYLLEAKYLVNGSINVIFNNGAGGPANQTANLMAKESAVYDGATWTPVISSSKAQVSVIDGTINGGGVNFSAGAVLSVNANTTAAAFNGWSGASAAYIFTDPSLPQAKLVVPSGVTSLALQALFATAADPFKSARNLYASQCASCHGLNGADGLSGGLNNLHVGGRYTLATLAKKINDSMPLNNPGLCVGNSPGTCAYDIANMILSNQWQPANTCPNGNCPSTKPSLDYRNLRLLTREEYLNSVRDIFASVTIDASVIAAIPADGSSRNFETASFLALDYDRTLGYQMAAEAIAKQVIASKPFFSLASGCGSDKTCLVKNLGRDIFRRPLSTEEVDRYAGLYETNDAGKAVIQGLLLSPNFLYRSEMGVETSPGSGLYRLTDYEIASLLSYSFWASTPDRTLLDSVASGSFDIKTQVTRLLADPRAERGLRRFAQGWLINGKYGYGVLSSQTLASAFNEETIRFAVESIKSNKPFNTMLTADYTYANSELAQYYGSSAVGSGWAQSTFADSDPRRGAGILGHGSFLSTRSSNADNPSPIKRGLFVRSVLLCQEMPPPQKAGTSIPRKPEDSNRTANANHTADPACAACHQFIDGIGFGFERFGSDAKYRTQEKLGNGNWQNIDASGWIKSLDSAETKLDPSSRDVDYDTVPELARLIADSGQASACYSRQFYRYIIGRNEELADEAIIPIYSAKLRAGGGMGEMLTELALSPGFILRR